MKNKIIADKKTEIRKQILQPRVALSVIRNLAIQRDKATLDIQPVKSSKANIYSIFQKPNKMSLVKFAILYRNRGGSFNNKEIARIKKLVLGIEATVGSVKYLVMSRNVCNFIVNSIYLKQQFLTKY
ncbi:MAG: hypothetical protein PHF25_07945 [Candidatus Margulisbacteria bacterium]|nr:hypothetical protein [Candidatus Margulisiibacteriota bacterium]